MRIDTYKLKQLRMSKHWSQEQLATVSGLTARTIQRIEATGKVSIESAKSLAAAFDVEVSEMLLEEAKVETGSEQSSTESMIEVIKEGFIQYSKFDGKASRSQYWLFFAFCFVSMAICTVISPTLASIAGLLILLPLLAIGSRRLHDAGYSGWWQLFALVPLGIIGVLYLLALESTKKSKKT